MRHNRPNMKTYLKTHIATLSMIAAFGCSLALAEPALETTKPLPWYQIELLIVEPVDPPLTNEKWPVVIEEPSPANMVELTAAVQSGGKAAHTKNRPVAFQLLRPREFELSKLADNLAKRGTHKIMMHLAWRQPLDENTTGPAVHIHNNIKESAIPVSIDPSASPVLNALPDLTTVQPGKAATRENFVDGTVTLTLSRYLHVKTHMIYFNPEVDLGRQIAAHEANTPVVERFLLKESRRVKRKEVHYLDHPYFGIIVQVTRYEDGEK